MLQVRDVMTPNVAALSPDDSLRDAMEFLARRHVSGVPVLRQGRLVGVVTAMDLIRVASTVPGVPTVRETQVELDTATEPSLPEEVEAEAEPADAYFLQLWDDSGAEVSEHVEAPEGPEWNPLDEHVVSEAMTLGALTIRADTGVSAAVALMRDKNVHRVFVTDDNDRLCGVVSALDIVRAAAAGRLARRTYVFNRDRDFDERGAE
jgi:CBS domain-containing protein